MQELCCFLDVHIRLSHHDNPIHAFAQAPPPWPRGMISARLRMIRSVQQYRCQEQSEDDAGPALRPYVDLFVRTQRERHLRDSGSMILPKYVRRHKRVDAAITIANNDLRHDALQWRFNHMTFGDCPICHQRFKRSCISRCGLEDSFRTVITQDIRERFEHERQDYPAHFCIIDSLLNHGEIDVFRKALSILLGVLAT